MVLSRLKIKHRLRSTRRKMFEKSTWVAGNSSQLMQKINILLDIGTTTGGVVYSAKSAAVDTAHAIEDMQCSDYPCANTGRGSTMLRYRCFWCVILE